MFVCIHATSSRPLAALLSSRVSPLLLLCTKLDASMHAREIFVHTRPLFFYRSALVVCSALEDQYKLEACMRVWNEEHAEKWVQEEGVAVSELQYGRHGENVTPGYLGLLVLACLLFLRDVTKIKGREREEDADDWLMSVIDDKIWWKFSFRAEKELMIDPKAGQRLQCCEQAHRDQRNMHARQTIMALAAASVSIN